MGPRFRNSIPALLGPNTLELNPYTKPGERKVGAARPKFQHLAPDLAQPTTRRERLNEKQAVAAERRAIKKSARRHLQRELDEELEGGS